MSTAEYRVESDSLGEVRVPASAYYGAQTQRAVENFPVSGIRFPRRFIRAVGLIKEVCARANERLGFLEPRLADAIARAAAEVAEGKLDDQFPLDIFQTGSGTSTNMNANEVIASRANELLGGRRGDKKPVHPNDHVNMAQSSNDVIPTAIHVAALEGVERDLLPALRALADAFDAKAREFHDVVKIGRTHLQDAVPMTLGQEFGGYASQVRHGIWRAEATRAHLSELGIGGTAIGTGLNAPPGFDKMVCDGLHERLGIPFRPAENKFEQLAARDAEVESSGLLKAIACSLMKIGNDLRLLSSGPRAGFGEIALPSLQPGSSIMPGKINPVMPEMVCMVAAQVIGNDAAVAVAGLSGTCELNVMKPVVAQNLLSSIQILSSACRLLAERCVKGIEANRKRCADLTEQSLALCTALNIHIGYDAAARIAKEAHKTGRTVREVAREMKLLPEADLARVLDVRGMTEGGLPGGKPGSGGG